MKYVLLSGIGVALAALAIVIVKVRQRAEPKDRGDRVAPSVLARINVEYHDS